MQLTVGMKCKTRDGRDGEVLRALPKSNKGNFTKVSEVGEFIVSIQGRWEKYNGDGSYIKTAILHPLDITEVIPDEG